MALHLTSDTLARIGEAQAALLAPLAAPTVRAWGERVTEVLCKLFHAETAVAVLPDRSVVTRDYDVRAAEVITHFVVEPERDGTPPPDPGTKVVMDARRARGLGVMTWPVIDRLLGGTLDASPFYHETVRAMAAHDLHGMYLPKGLADGEHAQVEVYHTHGARNPFGADGADVMALLVPAFAAGTAALARFDGHRAMLDVLPEPVAVYGADGRTIHRNAAFEHVLAADSQRLRVEAEAGALAREVGAGTVGARPERRVLTARGAYTLRAMVLPRGGGFGPAPAVVVTVMPPSDPWPDERALRDRFALTRREGEVAMLLARGLANDAVAHALCISPHTARRHTEQVMGKLDVAARAQVAAAILEPVPGP
ncbi:helix-turn-helix transcriptional regulator [Rubrivirga sp. IMCC43871]|uniref:helix-turn-helix transcriptional regulator n=1 Tax=Rubrivirga sp. IMCC43871 TaxID=3391575 RepID=UPI00398F993E